jgi:hypothetical protein
MKEHSKGYLVAFEVRRAVVCALAATASDQGVPEMHRANLPEAEVARL